MDPIYLALGGAVSGLAGIIFRIQEQRIKRAETGELFWRGKFFAQLGMTDMALDEAEKRDAS